MKYSLKVKLILSYALVALLLVGALSFISNVFLQRQFKSYIMEQQENKNKSFVTFVTQQYHADNMQWDAQRLESIGVNALQQGLILKIRDAQGNMLWDATLHNSGFCNQMITNMAQDMQSYYPGVQGGYESKSYPINLDAVEIGSVEVGYYGPFYYSESDVTFIKALNNLLFTVGIAASIAALFLGLFMAKRISDPIAKVINAAENISKGNFKDKINTKSGTKEIDRLISVVNNLALELDNQEKLRRRLTSDVAHELRTPLATLQSHVEAYIDGVWEPSKERLLSFYEELMRINRLVGNLSKLTALENENAPIIKTKADVKDLVTKAAGNFEAQFQAKNVGLEITGEAAEAVVDADKISQVIINLLSNALKYTPEGGKVSVNIMSENQNITMQVADSGSGIAQQDLPCIFERFYRTEQSRSSSTGGAGIGLTIAKAIVEMHGGSIEVQSELNKGTVFTVILPKE